MKSWFYLRYKFSDDVFEIFDASNGKKNNWKKVFENISQITLNKAVNFFK